MAYTMERSAVESCFTERYNLPENCGTFVASCSTAKAWIGPGLSIRLPLEIFFHSRHLNQHRQDTCGWALHSMARTWSLLLQDGWPLERVAELLTKEACPVWSTGLGYRTCPQLMEQMLKKAHTIELEEAKQPKERKLHE